MGVRDSLCEIRGTHGLEDVETGLGAVQRCDRESDRESLLWAEFVQIGLQGLKWLENPLYDAE